MVVLGEVLRFITPKWGDIDASSQRESTLSAENQPILSWIRQVNPVKSNSITEHNGKYIMPLYAGR